MDNTAPQATPTADIASIKKSNKRKLVWGLVCLIGPTALIVGALLVYALVNFISASMSPALADCGGFADVETCVQDSGFGDDSIGERTLNVIMFLTGAFSVATWLPGIIAGIILIATRKPVPQQ